MSEQMYSLGQVLKSLLRSNSAALFIMVCDDCAVRGDLDQTAHQFRAIVLRDKGSNYAPGMVDNSWNKGADKWKISSLEEASK